MKMFHPMGFMLASPIESTDEGLSYFSEAAVEDKYDGIRAQAHVSGGEVKFFSRTRDEITESFPELPAALEGLSQDAILDGEIVAWEYPANLADTQKIVDEPPSDASETKAINLGRARPFTALQQRLGRKKVSEKILRETPVAYLAFDILYAAGTLLIDRPLRERAKILDELLASIHHGAAAPWKNPKHAQRKLVFGSDQESELEISSAKVIRASVFRASSPNELEDLFTAAQARGNEGLLIKNLDSAYTPGKRGKSWLEDEA